jgi:hypothetical protein
MKQLTLFLAFMVFGIFASFVQIVEAPAPMSKGTNNAFSLELRTTIQKEVERSWEKYIKAYKVK